MRSIDEEIARHLEEAVASGELRRARGYGQPHIDDAGWSETPQALRMRFKILKDAGVVPAEIALMHERAALALALRDCRHDEERAALQRRYSEIDQAIALRLEVLRAESTL
jgi:hypothetical protein